MGVCCWGHAVFHILHILSCTVHMSSCGTCISGRHVHSRSTGVLHMRMCTPGILLGTGWAMRWSSVQQMNGARTEIP